MYTYFFSWIDNYKEKRLQYQVQYHLPVKLTCDQMRYFTSKSNFCNPNHSLLFIPILLSFDIEIFILFYYISVDLVERRTKEQIKIIQQEGNLKTWVEEYRKKGKKKKKRKKQKVFLTEILITKHIFMAYCRLLILAHKSSRNQWVEGGDIKKKKIIDQGSLVIVNDLWWLVPMVAFSRMQTMLTSFL